MTLKKLFLAHYNGDAGELRHLATELRLRGVAPWVDKDGGFSVADESQLEARRAIRAGFGVLLYATKSVFDRPFIRDVEMDEARKIKEENPAFLLFAVPRGINFEELQTRSQYGFRIDLSKFHTTAIPDSVNFETACAQVASDVLTKVVRLSVTDERKLDGSLSLQFSTRDVFPDEDDDVLCIDARGLFTQGVGVPKEWDRLLAALRDVKKEISSSYGRPRLRVHGSKHLTAAFMFGRVFAPFEIDIRQTTQQVWKTDASIPHLSPFAVSVEEDDPEQQSLFIEVASRSKDIGSGVDALLAKGFPRPRVRLQLLPQDEPLEVDNELCLAMVKQTYSEIERVMQKYRITEVHIFAAAPQSYLMMLGREFKGMPPTCLYEWEGDGSGYVCSYRIPGGVL